MREIKFRACDKRTKELIQIQGFKYVGEEHIQLFYFDADGCSNTCICEKEFIVLMQYTGIKDKNGTEIYGGDIVKFGEDEVLYEVYQHDSGSWEARGLSLWEWISENGNENEWEVIGNIYENPGLLEGKAGMEKQKSATEIIEEVREEICDEYCKHTDKALRGNNISELCNKCPLNRL